MFQACIHIENEDMGGGLYCVVCVMSTNFNDVLSCTTAKSTNSALEYLLLQLGLAVAEKCSGAAVAAVEAAFAGETAIEVVLVAAVAVAAPVVVSTAVVAASVTGLAVVVPV